MPAFLLSSAPGTTGSFPGFSLLTPNSETSKTGAMPTAIAGSFGESLSATMASLVKVSQSDNPEASLDLSKLSASLEELSAELEELDPALFDALRNFLNGQDLSPEGLENLQEGGELPDFFATLQSNLVLQTDLNDLTEAELAALDSTIAQINTLINQVDVQKPDDEQDTSVLPGFAFTIGKDGKVHLVNAPKAEASEETNVENAPLQTTPQQVSPLSDVSMQGQSRQDSLQQMVKPDSGQAGSTLQNTSGTNGAQNPQTLQSTTNVPLDQSLNPGVNDVVTETDKSFNEHFESLKSETPADMAESLLENASEVKDKSPISRFSDQQLKNLSEPFKPYSTTLMTPVDAKEWADEVGHKIVWFTGRNIQAAEMHLNPADLGPIEVKINVQNDVASVSFNVQNSSVRELLESNVVRLREMMESNGVNLGDVNVDSGSQDSYQEAQQSAQQMRSGNRSGSTELAADEIQSQTISVKSSNIVDYFV